MTARPFAKCHRCGVTVVQVKIDTAGNLKNFERPDSPALAAIRTNPLARAEFRRWAITTATPGNHPTGRIIRPGVAPLLYDEHHGLPHDIVCTHTRTRGKRRRPSALAVA